MDASSNLSYPPAATSAAVASASVDALGADNCSVVWTAPAAIGSSPYRSVALSVPGFRWVPVLPAPALALLQSWLLAAAALAVAALLAVLAAKALGVVVRWARRAFLLARLPHPPDRALIIGDLAAMVLPDSFTCAVLHANMMMWLAGTGV